MVRSSLWVTLYHPPKDWSLMALIGLLGLLVPFHVQAQDCDLACNSAQEAPVQLSIGTDCIVWLEADGILEAPQECEGMKSLVLRDEENILVADGMDQVQFDAKSYIGNTLSVTVTDVNTGVFCVGFVQLIDKLAPTLSNCEEVAISCIDNTSPDFTGYPTIDDNCSEDFDLTFEDNIIPGNCTSGTMKKIERLWIASDAFDNRDSCLQLITIERPTLDQIEFPENMDLSCDAPDADPTITGYPTFSGEVINSDNTCGLVVKMVADTAYICDEYEFQIHRSWLVTDECSGFETASLQIVHIKDTTPPEITCPTDFTVTTEGGDCISTIELEEPTITDNCDGGMEYDVITSFGAVGLGPHPYVPAGVHTVQYTATDACGNSSMCTMSVNVVDEDEPIAICEDFTIVSVPSGGIAMVMANTFDDGSFDNC